MAIKQVIRSLRGKTHVLGGVHKPDRGQVCCLGIFRERGPAPGDPAVAIVEAARLGVNGPMVLHR